MQVVATSYSSFLPLTASQLITILSQQNTLDKIPKVTLGNVKKESSLNLSLCSFYLFNSANDIWIISSTKFHTKKFM